MLNEMARGGEKNKKKTMQNMKSQDPDMYQDGWDFITYSVVIGNIRRKKKASPPPLFFRGLSSLFSHEAEEV